MPKFTVSLAQRRRSRSVALDSQHSDARGVFMTKHLVTLSEKKH